MKKTTKIIIVAVVVGCIAAMGFTLVSNKKEINSRNVVKASSQEITVTAVAASIQATSGNLQLVGTAEPSREVMVPAETAGKIVQLNFKLGDYVNQGTVLAKIDDTYKRLALENAQLNYNKYKDDYERYQNLRKGDAVTETQLRDIKVAFDNAAIQLENAQKQLSDTRVVAPFSGYITSKNIELGAYVNVGASIAGMADIAQLKVTLSVSESNVYELHQGQAVNVTSSIYPDMQFKGTISNISPKGDKAHKYPVEVMISNTGKKTLKAGAYVNVDINLGNEKPALMIPRDAIVSSVKDPSVYLVQEGIVHLVRINTGRDYQSSLEVVSGLSEGDMVVTNGQINLTDGAKVSIIKN